MRRALLLVAVAALALPGVAGAHANLMRAIPAEQGRVEAPPTSIELFYDQSVVAPADAIVVMAADGRRVSGTVTQS